MRNRQTVEELLARHGRAFTSGQARDAGLPRWVVDRALRKGIVRRAGRGVFVDARDVGARVTAVATAAAMAGDAAVVSHRLASWYYELDGVPNLFPEFSVEHGVRRRRVIAHQRPRLEELEIVEADGMLITSVRQTLADLGSVVDADVVERAAESALRKGLVDELSLLDFSYLWAYYRWGSPTLHHVMQRRGLGQPATGSDIETIGIQRYRAGGVPAPQRQLPVYLDGEFVGRSDYGWPWEHYLTEVDGFETHGVPEALQHDLNRQNRFADAGYAFRRFTWADVMHRPAYFCRETLRGLHLARCAQMTRIALLG